MLTLPYTKCQDKLYPLDPRDISFNNNIDTRIRILIDNLYKRVDFSKLVDYFRLKLDPFAAGEFWGKMLRSASVIYQYTRDESLKAVIDASVADMLSVQAEDGEISTTPRQAQPNGTHGSDLWERKYVLLGLWAYYEATMSEDALRAMVKLTDYTARQVGAPPKTPITETGWAFYGIESSSILEPIMKLYRLTGREEYLRLGRHIVEETGACKRQNIFEAIRQGTAPKDIGSNGNPRESIAKAYEMMSCFEGLLEYYRATGEARWLEIASEFVAKVIEREITLLGSGGADKPYNLGPGIGEQWNDTAYEQTNPDISYMMETCVTITYMKLCHQLLRLNGDSRLADQIEISMYNALFGAEKPTGDYFEYFPRFNGVRSSKVNFTANIGDFPLSCCTANGPAGIGLIPMTAVMRTERGIAVNFFEAARVSCELENTPVNIEIVSEYPARGQVIIKVSPTVPKCFDILIRVPAWSANTSIAVNGTAQANVRAGEYYGISREWTAGDEICVTLDMRCEIIPAPHGSNRKGDAFCALRYGPIVLSRDKRLDPKYSSPVTIVRGGDGCAVCESVVTDIPDVRVALRVKTTDGYITVINYSAAGSSWDESSEFCTWMPTGGDN